VRYSQREKNEPGEPPLSSRKPEERTIPFSQRLSCTIDEACEATSLGRTKLYELIGAGQLATITVGRRRLVMVRGLLSLLWGRRVSRSSGRIQSLSARESMTLLPLPLRCAHRAPEAEHGDESAHSMDGGQPG
jgi:excisionase family DNA binding protein